MKTKPTARATAACPWHADKSGVQQVHAAVCLVSAVIPRKKRHQRTSILSNHLAASSVAKELAERGHKSDDRLQQALCNKENTHAKSLICRKQQHVNTHKATACGSCTSCRLLPLASHGAGLLCIPNTSTHWVHHGGQEDVQERAAGI
jgi:hypothetical protein